MMSPVPTERSALLGSEASAATRSDTSANSDNADSRRRLRRSVSKSFGRVGHRTRVRVAIVAIVAVLLGGAVLTVVLVTGRGGDGGLGAEPVEFDAIVVGGGPAGSVVSKLLSDDTWRRVLLIEAGDASQVELGGRLRIKSPYNTRDLTPFDVPFFWTNVANTPSYHWDYPDVNIVKALGGCGVHNAMLYVRALPTDLDRWAMKSWTWKKALEIYTQMESFDGPDADYHGKTGNVRTSPPSDLDKLSQDFIEACQENGIPLSTDFNAPAGRFGAGYYHFNTRDGIRESAARRFLGPIIKGRRKNFHLKLNTIVKRLIINEASTMTEGVEVEKPDGSREVIRVAKNGQVIVTAGAINTPAVLMLSGIGHGDDLNALGIPVKKHLPRVGMNLQDHPVLAMKFESPQAEPVHLPSELKAYFSAIGRDAANASSYGLMGSAGLSAGAFLIPPGSTVPEIQLTFFPRKSEPHVSNSSALSHDPQILVTIALLHPKARNRVVLMTKDKKDYIPRVLSEVPEQEAEHLRGDDVWKLSWGITVVRQIAMTLANKGVVGKELEPGTEVATMQDLNEWVPSAVFRNSHWVGSAAMGTSQNEGVVDNRLRVFGINNLRVADASVIPTIPNGNVHSSVLMVASHAAEIIKRDEEEVASSS